MIAKETLETLHTGKNILAFSAGVDSTALFFLLCEANISFDIAIVNYGLRVEAKEEVEYAQELAKRYNKKIYTAIAPKFKSNFEANARNFRYNFFEQLTKEHNYTNLITAHQLNDNLEWLLMRLSQGSGVEGLSGMDFVEQRENYTIVRPLLHQSKEELLEYLEENRFTYFIDQSNFENKYLRNQFRPLVNDLLAKGKSGYIKSLQILQSEKEALLNNFQTIHKIEELRVLHVANCSYLPYALSKTLKELGYLLSGKERMQLSNSMVVGRKWAVEYQKPYLFIAPYTEAVLPKKSKEFYRKKRIPPKIRGYLYTKGIDISSPYFDVDQAVTK